MSPADARQSELDALRGTIVEVAPAAELPREELQAIAQWLESQSKAQMVQVRVRKEASGPGRLEVEIWGDTAMSESLDADLRAAFPSLADADITRADLEGPPPAADEQLTVAGEASKDEDPEAVKARIIEQMRAQGVEGDIVVEVIDGPDGERRVEVKVERHEAGEK